MEDVTKAGRAITWKATKKSRLETESTSFPINDGAAVRQNKKTDTSKCWAVNYTARHGLLQPKFQIKRFTTKKEANAFFKQYRKRKIVVETILCEIPNGKSDGSLQKILDEGEWSKYWAQDTKTGKPVDPSSAEEVLLLADVVDGDLKTSQKVLDFLSSSRLDELKLKFPDTWNFVAEFEYSILKFPLDSSAFVAAAARYCGFFSNDSFLFGYLIRDLELLRQGVELKYKNAIDNNRRLKKNKRKKDTEKIEGRWTTLIETMVGIINGTIKCKFRVWKIESLAKYAGKYLTEKKDINWRAGGVKSVLRYLDAIGEGQAGKPLQSKLKELPELLKIHNNQYVMKRST